MEVVQGDATLTCDVVVNRRGNQRNLQSSKCDPLRPQLAGAYQAADPNDAKFQEMAVFAVDQMNESPESSAIMTLLKITSAAIQHSGGINYKMTMQVSRQDEMLICEAIVNSQAPWSNKKTMLSSSCTPDSGAPFVTTESGPEHVDEEEDETTEPEWATPASLLDFTTETEEEAFTTIEPEPVTERRPTVKGGFNAVDVNDPAVQKVAAFSTRSITRSSNGDSEDLIRVIEAERQVVNGFNYRLKMETTTRICTVKVFHQPRDDVIQVKEHTCVPTSAPFIDTTTTDPSVHQTTSTTTTTERAALRGGFRFVNTDDSDVVDVAEFATNTLSSRSNSGPLTLVRVVEARTQVVSGKNYRLKLEVRGSSSGTATLICQVNIYDQPWTKTRRLDDFNCEPTDTSSSFKISAESPATPQGISTTRPEATTTRIPVTTTPEETATTRRTPVRGGFLRTNANDARVREVAVFAVGALTSSSNGDEVGELVRIVEAEKQVVNGYNYRLKLETTRRVCTVKVFEKARTKVLEVKDFVCDPPFAPPSASAHGFGVKTPPARDPAATAPQFPIVGGYRSADVDDAQVKEMAVFATTTISQSSNGRLRLIRIIEVETQVVAGTNYRMKIELQGESDSQTCTVTVFDQPWTKTRQLREFSCIPSSAPSVPARLTGVSVRPAAINAAHRDPPTLPRLELNGTAPQFSIAGAYRSADVNDAQVREMADFATTAISQSSNGRLRLIRIIEVETQVVAGINFRMKIELQGELESQICTATVFDQPWTKTRQLSEFSCTPYSAPSAAARPTVAGVRPALKTSPHRVQTTRLELNTTTPQFHISGRYITADVNDPQVKEMADFATTTISQSSNGKLRLIRIIEVETQVVAGINFRMKIELQGELDSQICTATVFDQPWTKTRQLSEFSCVVTPALPAPSQTLKAPLIRGGFNTIDVNDARIQQVASFAAMTLSSSSSSSANGGGDSGATLIRVLEAQRQVVNGFNYRLKIQTTANICSVKVFEHPASRVLELKESSCASSGAPGAAAPSGAFTPATPGGFRISSTDDPTVQEMAAFATKQLSSRWNSQSVTLIRITSAEQQVVAGTNYKMTMELQVGSGSQTCQVVVFDQPWTSTRQLSSFECTSTPRTSFKSSVKTSSSHRVQKRSADKRPEHKGAKLNRLKHMKSFRAFAAQFGKRYDNWAEFEHRYRVYRHNQKRIQLLQQNEMGTAVYGDTEFSDLTEKEFRARFTGLDRRGRHSSATGLTKAEIPDVKLPDEFDWRHLNAVTPVKDQGQCGSCWAFSVTGNVEGMYSVKHGALISLSEQELVDCDKLDNGCNGGLMENAYKAIQDLGGLELEADYPYKGHQNKCSLDKNITQVQVNCKLNHLKLL